MRRAAPALAILLIACEPPGPEVSVLGVGGAFDAGDLVRFDGCDAVREHLTDVAVETLLQGTYGGMAGEDPRDEDGDGAAGAFADENGEELVASELRTPSVDDVDRAKTDGTHLYALENGALQVVRIAPGSEATLLATLPIEGYPQGLLHSGDAVVVLSRITTATSNGLALRSWAGSRMTVVDVSLPDAPVVTRTVDVEGSYVGARSVGEGVTLVARTELPLPGSLWDVLWAADLALPDLAWDAEDQTREEVLDAARVALRPLVEQAVADLDLDALLPRVLDEVRGESFAPEALLACTDLYRPPDLSPLAVLDVVHLDLFTAERTATGLLADGTTAHATGESLYVAQASWGWGWEPVEATTRVHAFDLRGARPTYRASGEVDGWLRDHQSMSGWDDHLRLITTVPASPDRAADTRLTVLSPRGRHLLEVGALSGLESSGSLAAVRLDGPRGYLVSGRADEAMQVLDLSEPSLPRLAGSVSLDCLPRHLLATDGDHLAVIGRTSASADAGPSVALLDVSDPFEPVRDHLRAWPDGGWQATGALWEDKAFSVQRGLLTLPVLRGGEDAFAGALVVSIDPLLGIAEAGRIDHGALVLDSDCLYNNADCEVSAAPVEMRRAMVVGDELVTVSNYGVVLTDRAHPELERARVLFRPAR